MRGTGTSRHSLAKLVTWLEMFCARALKRGGISKKGRKRERETEADWFAQGDALRSSPICYVSECARCSARDPCLSRREDPCHVQTRKMDPSSLTVTLPLQDALSARISISFMIPVAR